MDDASDLRERVSDLEQTVSDQQATITELRERGVSRRGVLAGGAGLGAIGLGVLGSQSASAQAAGQVGTESDPVDVEAATLNAGSVNAGSATIGGQVFDFGFEEVDTFDASLGAGDSIDISFSSLESGEKLLLDIQDGDGNLSGAELRMTANSVGDGNYAYEFEGETPTENADYWKLLSVSSNYARCGGTYLFSRPGNQNLSLTRIHHFGRYGRFESLAYGSTMSSINSDDFSTISVENGGTDDFGGFSGRVYINRTGTQ